MIIKLAFVTVIVMTHSIIMINKKSI